jgi:hypothetical protein
MKTTKFFTILVLALSLMVWQAEVSKAEPMSTAFTYQGRLMDANGQADGVYDLQFALFTDPNLSSSQIGPAIVVNDIDIIDGYFTIELDFGNKVFGGDARWLEIGIRPWNSEERYTLLSPQQEVTPTPYALYAKSADTDNDWMISGNDMYSIPSGNIGIGTTSPSEKLDVEGNIDVSSNQIKNYYGFPRPNYDSGWVPISKSGAIILTHGLGGNVDNYVVDMQFRASPGCPIGINCRGYGGQTSAIGDVVGGYYQHLGTQTIEIGRHSDDCYAAEIRVRIWIYN